MTLDDLVTDRKSDAAAPRLGGAFIEFLLHIGQLRLRDAGAEVADGDDVFPVALGQVDGDAPAAAAVLGGVVQQVAEHLLEPLRVAGDQLLVLGAVCGVFQRDAVLTEQLAVAVNGVLQLRLEVGVLHLQGEAAVLQTGELQQLLHHIGQAAGFLHHDLHAPLQLLNVAGVVRQQRLAPAVDCRQRGAELVGDGGDELGFHALTLADLAGHIVDVGHQLPHLVGVFVGDLDAVAAAGDALCRLGHGGDGCHHVVNEYHAGKDDQSHHRQHNARHQHDRQHDLTVDIAEGGDVAHDAHHLPVEFQQAGHRQNVLAGDAVAPHVVLHHAALHRRQNLRRAGVGAGGDAAGGDLHPAGTVEELQLDAVAVVKGGGVDGGTAVVFPVAGHHVGVEVVRAGGGLRPERGAGRVVVVAGEAHGDEHAHQQQYDQHGTHAAGEPPAAQSLHLAFFCRHGVISFRKMG